MKFNLKKFIKEAMGAFAWRYRSQIMWCSLEDAIRGTPIASVENDKNDPTSPPVTLTWSELKNKRDNGVRTSLYEILNFRAKTDRFFKARYGLNDAKLREVFQIMVGYHPFYGLYMCSVGPYYASDTMWQKTKEIANGRPIDNAFLDEIIASTEQQLENELDEFNKKKLNSNLSAVRSVKADINNRFGFFTKRHQRATYEEIQKSAMGYIKGVIDQLSNVMDTSDIKLTPADIRLVLKKATGKLKGTKNCEFQADVYDGLNNESPDAQELFKSRPVLGEGSYLEIKPNILTKLILRSSNGWQQVYNEAILQIAKQNLINSNKPKKGQSAVTITDEMIRQEASIINTSLQDENFDGSSIIKQVLQIAKTIKDKMSQEGDPNAELLRIPDLKIMSTHGVGTAKPTTLGIKADQIHKAELRADILKTIVEIGSDDPVKISAALNTGVRAKKINNLMAKGKITQEEIKQFIARCKEERKVRVKGKFSKTKTYEQLSQESQKQLEDLKNAINKKDMSGFDNLEEAFVMASLSLSSTGSDAIDPATKANISSVFMPPPDLFNRGENNVNYTTEQISSMRRGEEEEQEAFENIPKASPRDIEIEIGVSKSESVMSEEVEETETDNTPIEEETVEPVSPQEGTQSVTPENTDHVAEEFPITEIPQQTMPTDQTGQPDQPITSPEKGEEVNTVDTVQKPILHTPKKRVKPSNFSKLFSNSIGTLIKLARDLDQKGKCSASEEIHKIIRKYEKGL